jgi:hypothetical protein
MKTDPGTMGEEEPGTVENRLSVNVNDERWSSAVESWEDGQEYEATVKLRQIGPGEFEVLSMDTADEYEEDGEIEPGDEAPKTAEATKDRAVKGVTNPAVIGLLGKKR